MDIQQAHMKINVDDVRYGIGYEMGQNDETELDVSSVLPDSGTGMAIGFAHGKRIPYTDVLL